MSKIENMKGRVQVEIENLKRELRERERERESRVMKWRFLVVNIILTSASL